MLMGLYLFQKMITIINHEQYCYKLNQTERKWNSLSKNEKILSIIDIINLIPQDNYNYSVKSHDIREISNNLRFLNNNNNIVVRDYGINRYHDSIIEINSSLLNNLSLMIKVLVHEGTHYTDSLNAGWGEKYYTDHFYAAVSEINAHRNEIILLESLECMSKFGDVAEYFNSVNELKNGFDGIHGYSTKGLEGMINVFRYRIYSKPGNYWQYYADRCDFRGVEEYFSKKERGFLGKYFNRAFSKLLKLLN